MAVILVQKANNGQGVFVLNTHHPYTGWLVGWLFIWISGYWTSNQVADPDLLWAIPPWEIKGTKKFDYTIKVRSLD